MFIDLFFHFSANSTLPPNRQNQFSTTTPPPTDLNLFAETETEQWHLCAHIRQYTRQKRFLSYVFGAFLSLTINGALVGSQSASSLKLPDCPNGTIPFASTCIDQFYDNCPANMVNLNFFQ